MAAKVTGVAPGSPADGLIRAGDTLLRIGGEEICDVLDYMYHGAGEELEVELLRGEKNLSVRIKKECYEDLGLEFASYLMDEQKNCRNKCIFCFIDQLPKGLRETLYFKDDDARMSLLRGNYITLTNLSESEIERIIRLRISPINISVHTVDPELRVQMMKNKRAGEVLPLMRRFAEAGITMNCQVVLCRGINDGEKLRETIETLAGLHPAVQSLSVVPVGLTRYREGLYPLRPFDRESAGAVLDLINGAGDRLEREIGVRFVYPGDEFFIKAGRNFPDYDYYDDFPQIENGVGMVTLMRDEFEATLQFVERSDEPRSVTLVTGVAAAPYLEEMLAKLRALRPNLKAELVAVENRFFGPEITVAGLLVGRDVIDALRGKKIKRLLLPTVMLRYENDMFLDNVTVEQLAQELDTEVELLDPGGENFISAVLGEEI